MSLDVSVGEDSTMINQKIYVSYPAVECFCLKEHYEYLFVSPIFSQSYLILLYIVHNYILVHKNYYIISFKNNINGKYLLTYTVLWELFRNFGKVNVSHFPSTRNNLLTSIWPITNCVTWFQIMILVS